MKKLHFTIIGLLVILSISCSKKLILSSSYQSAPLNIDGSPSDWVDSLAFDVSLFLAQYGGAGYFA